MVNRDLRGRVVIITGASSGIGAATAVACGRAGMRVVLAARREDLLREVGRHVEAAGGEALVCPADVSELAPIEALVAATLARFGRVDVLLANSGVGYSGPLAKTTDEQVVSTAMINLVGVIRCARAVLPTMIEQGGGHIITVSSVAAGIASPRAAVYAATKAGVHRFAEGLRREVAAKGIHVTDVLPGVIDTPMTAYSSDMPKAPVGSVADALVGLMRRPRKTLVIPTWYHAVLAANRLLPWVVDSVLARQLAHWEQDEVPPSPP